MAQLATQRRQWSFYFTVSANACVKITDDGCLPFILFINENDVQCTIAIWDKHSSFTQ